MITISTIQLLAILIILGYAVYASIRIYRMKTRAIRILLKRLEEIKAATYYEVHITLEDMEEMFDDGKARAYETPHGTLHVIPDPKHVIFGAES